MRGGIFDKNAIAHFSKYANEVKDFECVFGLRILGSTFLAHRASLKIELLA